MNKSVRLSIDVKFVIFVFFGQQCMFLFVTLASKMNLITKKKKMKKTSRHHHLSIFFASKRIFIFVAHMYLKYKTN